jgi:hypothetical protein
MCPLILSAVLLSGPRAMAQASAQDLLNLLEVLGVELPARWTPP